MLIRSRCGSVLLLAVIFLLLSSSPCFAAIEAERLQGSDRYETCAEIATRAY